MKDPKKSAAEFEAIMKDVEHFFNSEDGARQMREAAEKGFQQLQKSRELREKRK
jgi:hypothetical protein